MAAAPDASQLRQALDDNLKRVIDLFRDWDEDCSGTVSKREFRKALPMLGIRCKKEQADALFDSLDDDGSGELEYNEMKRHLRISTTSSRRMMMRRRVWLVTRSGMR